MSGTAMPPSIALQRSTAPAGGSGVVAIMRMRSGAMRPPGAAFTVVSRSIELDIGAADHRRQPRCFIAQEVRELRRADAGDFGALLGQLGADRGNVEHVVDGGM